MQLFSQSFVVVIESADIVSAFAKHMLKVFFRFQLEVVEVKHWKKDDKCRKSTIQLIGCIAF